MLLRSFVASAVVSSDKSKTGCRQWARIVSDRLRALRSRERSTAHQQSPNSGRPATWPFRPPDMAVSAGIREESLAIYTESHGKARSTSSDQPHRWRSAASSLPAVITRASP